MVGDRQGRKHRLVCERVLNVGKVGVQSDVFRWPFLTDTFHVTGIYLETIKVNKQEAISAASRGSDLFTGTVQNVLTSLVPVRRWSREMGSRQVRFCTATFLPRLQAAACFPTVATCPNGYENTCFCERFGERNKAQWSYSSRNHGFAWNDSCCGDPQLTFWQASKFNS